MFYNRYVERVPESLVVNFTTEEARQAEGFFDEIYNDDYDESYFYELAGEYGGDSPVLSHLHYNEGENVLEQDVLDYMLCFEGTAVANKILRAVRQCSF